MDIESLKYKSTNLEQGWIVKSDSASSEKITWITRETSDYRNDLQKLAYDLKNELKYDSKTVSQSSIAFSIIFYFATFPRKRKGRETHSPRTENTMQSGRYYFIIKKSRSGTEKQILHR